MCIYLYVSYSWPNGWTKFRYPGGYKSKKNSLKNSKFVFFQGQCQVLQRVYVMPGAKCAEFHLFLPSC